MAITFNPAISNKSYMNKKKQNPAFGSFSAMDLREAMNAERDAAVGTLPFNIENARCWVREYTSRSKFVQFHLRNVASKWGHSVEELLQLGKTS